MHSAVLQNKKYIKFSRGNTVEVIALGRLEKGIAEGDRKAATYEAKGPDGEKVEYLVEWPNLTVEEMKGLRRSKAATYNKTGKIPYTCIVDPWTLEEVEGFLGGQSAKTLIEAAQKARRQLIRERGRGVSRREILALDHAAAEARALAEEGRFSKALKLVDRASRNAQEWPDALKTRAEGIRQSVIDEAKATLDRITALGETDSGKALRELRKIKYRLRDTGLEERAEQLQERLRTGN